MPEGPQEKALMNSALLAAIEEDKHEAIRALLLHTNKYSLVTLANALISAFRNSRAASVKLIYEYVLASSHREELTHLLNGSEEIAHAAILSNNSSTLSLALELSFLVGEMGSEQLRECAIVHDKSISLEFLLEGGESGSYLKLACRSNARHVVSFILSDVRTTQEQIIEGIGEATKRLFELPNDKAASTSVLQALISDGRISSTIRQVIHDEWTTLRSHSRSSSQEKDFLLIIATTQDLDLSLLDPTVLSEILALRNPFITQTGKWSGVIGASIQESIESPSSNLDYLLREIIVKRLPPEYYLKWLLSRARVNIELGQVLSSAARSLLLLEDIVYTSDELVAYSGFLLFMLTDTSKSKATQVLSILERENTSHRGVRLAAALIGASLELSR